MWTLDDEVSASLRRTAGALEDGDEKLFLENYEKSVRLLQDLMEKEEVVLFPTAMEMLSYDEFQRMWDGDDAGRFCGVLEMMQDATHIRSLEGNQRLLSWKKKENIK